MHTTIADDENEESKSAALLLNNRSNIDQFVNSKYLKNISTIKQKMAVYCNEGKSSTNRECLGKFQFGTTQMGL